MGEPSPFTRRPRSADEFIQDATLPPSPEAPGAEAGLPPWTAARDDVTKPYQLRLPEKHYLMLKYIAEKTPYSMHAFCLETLLSTIENKALELYGGCEHT